MIKIITLLEIIAKGTGKIPTKIKWLGNIYLYNGFDYVYRYEDEDFDGVLYVHLMDNVALCSKWLNESVEVISYE